MHVLKTVLLLSYICIASFSAALITPALPAIGQFFQISQADLSWIISIFLIGYVIGQLVYGPIAKRFGALQALRYGLVLNLIGIVICIAGPHLSSYSILLFGRFITALGSASGLACTFMLMHDLLDSHSLKQAMAYSIVSFTLGIGVAVMIGGIVTQYLNWQSCFWILFLHGGLMLALTWQFQSVSHERQALHPVVILRNYCHALKSSQLIIFSLVVGVMSVFSYGYAAIAPLYTQEKLALSASVYGYWNGLNMVGMLAGGLLSARLMKNAGPKRLLSIGFCGMLICSSILLMVGLTHIDNTLVFFITTTLAYLFGGFLFAGGSYFASQAITDKANGASMMSFINMFSAFLGVIVIGLINVAPLLSFAIVLNVFLIVTLLLSLFFLMTKQIDL